MTCPRCGQQVYPNTPACPRCGLPFAPVPGPMINQAPDGRRQGTPPALEPYGYGAPMQSPGYGPPSAQPGYGPSGQGGYGPPPASPNGQYGAPPQTGNGFAAGSLISEDALPEWMRQGGPPAGNNGASAQGGAWQAPQFLGSRQGSRQPRNRLAMADRLSAHSFCKIMHSKPMSPRRPLRISRLLAPDIPARSRAGHSPRSNRWERPRLGRAVGAWRHIRC